MASAPQQPSGGLGPSTHRPIGQLVSNSTSTAVPREELSTVVADIIALMQGDEPTESGFQLYEHIDPEALDRLFDHACRHEGINWHLEFDIGGETVVIESNGFVSIG